MSTSLAKAKLRYAEQADAARRFAGISLSALLGVNFHLSGWTGKARESYFAQWVRSERHPDAGWDWDEIFSCYRNEPDRLEIAVWSAGDRLSGLGLAKTTQAAVCLEFLEGDARPSCPLRGRRALIALEACAAYAQGRGKAELRLQPVNSSLENLYVETYGFELVTPARGVRYFRKGV